MSIHEWTIHELGTRLQAGEVSAREAVEACLARIDTVDRAVGGFLTLRRELAQQEAEAADARRAAGESRGPLDGVPLAVKDNMCTKGTRTTCGSRILKNFTPPYDATVVARLREAGMPILGKTNMDEFAMGSSTENSALQVTRNPWDLDRVPGGSSGGSAAAVAADETIAAIGSDTGGSIRQPASFCGIVGLKPTYGRVSRYGLVAFASSLDQIGPLTKDVRDSALLLNTLAGRDPLDATSADVATPDFTAGLQGGVQGLRVGLPQEYFAQGIAPVVRAAVQRAVEQLQELGAEVEEVSLPHTDYALAAYYLIAPAEASSNLARYDGVRYGLRAEDAPDVGTMFEQTRAAGFGVEVKRRIMLGTYALSTGYYDAYYRKAQQVRTLVSRDFAAAFEQVDLLVAPTAPIAAFPTGERLADPLAMYAVDVLTLPVNLAGLPGISLPCGLDDDGLPIGLQMIGKPFAEATILQAAAAYEQAVGPRQWRARMEVSSDGW